MSVEKANAKQLENFWYTHVKALSVLFKFSTNLQTETSVENIWKVQTWLVMEKIKQAQIA